MFNERKGNKMTMRFELREKVAVIVSGEAGEVVGRAEYSTGEPQYYVRYKAADGRAVESWWPGEALQSVLPF